MGRRTPSESDIRTHAFSQLAAGYTGLQYFAYQEETFDGILTSEGQKTPLYDVVTSMNAELQQLGSTLRLLTSEDVRFVAGRHTADDTPHPALPGLSALTEATARGPRNDPVCV